MCELFLFRLVLTRPFCRCFTWWLRPWSGRTLYDTYNTTLLSPPAPDGVRSKRVYLQTSESLACPNARPVRTCSLPPCNSSEHHKGPLVHPKNQSATLAPHCYLSKRLIIISCGQLSLKSPISENLSKSSILPQMLCLSRD